jgi:hypothetical protein
MRKYKSCTCIHTSVGRRVMLQLPMRWYVLNMPYKFMNIKFVILFKFLFFILLHVFVVGDRQL